jgi:RNA polymerase sigma-70 factor (ECF subfamily)
MSADVEGLFAEYHQRLFRYLYRALGHQETARDLTQDVFLRVSRVRVPDSTGPEQQAWLFRIARNLLIDHYRRRERSPEVPATSGVSSRPASQETSTAIREALAGLDELDRDVFLMREVAGLDYEQIAAACELSIAAVRSRLHRTRLDLRQRLTAPIAHKRTTPMRLGFKGKHGDEP